MRSGAWIDNLGKPLAFEVDTLVGRHLDEARDALLKMGLRELLIHGVSRPQRMAEVESLFIIASPGRRSTERQRLYLDLLVPHLHSTYLRVQSVELEMNDSSLLAPREAPVRSAITERERQILGWVREGMSNQQIGTELSISPLTVKNHVQKDPAQAWGQQSCPSGCPRDDIEPTRAFDQRALTVRRIFRDRRGNRCRNRSIGSRRSATTPRPDREIHLCQRACPVEGRILRRIFDVAVMHFGSVEKSAPDHSPPPASVVLDGGGKKEVCRLGDVRP